MENHADYELIKQKAVLLKALSNPVRLCIVRELLERGACKVGEMQNCLALSQSTVSQHLGRLRDLGLISGARRGTSVFYRVSSEEAAEIVKILFQPKNEPGRKPSNGREGKGRLDVNPGEPHQDGR